MTIRQLVRQGLHYARHCRSLWLFGFIVGATGGGSSAGGKSGGGSGLSFALGPVSVAGAEIALAIAAVVVLVAIAALVLRFVSEGALIEGVARARQGGRLTTVEAWRAGLAHWGVLLRIGLLYVGVTIASVILLALPCVLGVWLIGPLAFALLGIPALLVAVPWLITLYLLQAFASQIAVLEHRHAFDAIRKARLFLHGRLGHGLRLVVAMLLGTVVIVAAGSAIALPVALVLFVLARVAGLAAVVAIALAVLVPVVFVLTAMAGTLRSSIWTIGYLDEVGA